MLPPVYPESARKGFISRLLRHPSPRTFLYTMSLTTGASLITLSLLLNKVSGLYGLLALLTGFELDSLQLSMYIYSLIALGLAAYLAPYIRTQSPLHALALAWFYVIDSVINAAYTAAFGVTWFLVLAQHNAGKAVGDKAGPGAGTIDSTSGFTNPQENVTRVHIVSDDGIGGIGGIGGTPASSAAGVDGNGNLGRSVLQSESMNSLGVIIGLWTIRLYFCVIMFSYARMVLRQHIALTSRKSNSYTAASPDSGLAENPFDESRPEGQGWKGKQGRLMVAFPKRYWLGSADTEGGGAGGAEEDVRWMQGMGGKFRNSGAGAGAGAGVGGPVLGPGPGSGSNGGNALGNHVMETGPLERERRRRSGTGPPPPSIQLSQPGQNGLSIPLQDL